MTLDELPIEIISRISRFLDYVRFPYFRNENKNKNNKTDFQSLRNVCKSLYYKTEYDAAVRYRYKLERLKVEFNRRSIEQLLRISNIPAFRDKIYTISFHLLEVDHEKHDVIDWATIVLVECFRNLQSARNLQLIELGSNFGHDFLLRAMALAHFSRKLVCLTIRPEHVLNWRYGGLLNTPETFRPYYIKCLRIQSPMQKPKYRHAGLSMQQSEGKPPGSHIKDYLPTTAEFTKLMSAFVEVEEISLLGCLSSPGLRFCHGCDDLFVKNIVPVFYHNLRRFELRTTFISGGRLRRFIKRHADSLTSFEANHVILTDASWRSIAQGLFKLPHLSELNLLDLWQKHAAKPAAQPVGFPSTHWVSMKDRTNVQHFLETLIQGFSTVKREDSRYVRGLPQYHQVTLFDLPSSKPVFGFDRSPFQK